MTTETFILGSGDDGPVPVNVPALIDTRLLITASSGGGKSYALRRIIEQIARQVQVIVIDPEGEFATLREKLDMLLIGPGGEVAPEIHSARLLARKLAELRVGAVVDLYGMDDWDTRRLWLAEFISGLMAIPKPLYHPIFIPIDEAHMFAPEQAGGRSDSPIAQSRAAVRFLMTAGRKRAICGALATHRISKIDKDATEPARNVMIGGITLDIDQARAGDTLGISKKDRVALRDLPAGGFYAFGPALPRGVSQFTVGEVATTHPRPGQKHLIEVPPASAAVQKILGALADLPREAQAEADTLLSARQEAQELRAENLRLAHALRDREAAPPPLPARQVPIFRENEIMRLESAMHGAEGWARRMEQLFGEAQSIGVEIRAGQGAIAAALANTEKIMIPDQQVKNDRGQARPMRPAEHSPDTLPANIHRLTPYQQSIINALAWAEAAGLTPINKPLLMLLAGRNSTKSSTFDNNIGAMRSSGFIEYPSPGAIAITQSGRQRASLPTGQKITQGVMQEMIIQRLPAYKAEILRALIAIYPDPIHKDDLARRLNRSVSSSTYDNNLGSLRTLHLINYPRPGHLVARSLLFQNGARR